MNRPMLQIALDLYDQKEAVELVKETHEFIDVIEIGTILCLAEGVHAVRSMREAFPDKIILADVRIIKAGEKIAKMAFEAGANWVSIVSSATEDTIEAVLQTAKKYNGDVQVELCDGWTLDQVQSLLSKGIKQFIYHRSTEVTDSVQSWSQKELDLVKKLTNLGCQLSITGGIKHSDVNLFRNLNVYIIIAGRSICQSENPKASAEEYANELNKIGSFV